MSCLVNQVEAKSGVSTFDLLDFMLALVHLAAQRYAAENPSQAAYNHLSLKVRRQGSPQTDRLPPRQPQDEAAGGTAGG
jgi:hypothetical protein